MTNVARDYATTNKLSQNNNSSLIQLSLSPPVLFTTEVTLPRTFLIKSQIAKLAKSLLLLLLLLSEVPQFLFSIEF